MPKQERIPTKYKGVYYVNGTSANGKKERIYYIRYRKNGKLIEEKAGRQFQNDMTPARGSNIRVKRVEGETLSNEERRQAEEAEKLAQTSRWTISRLWEEYKKVNTIKGIVTDENRFKKYLKEPFGDNEPVEIAPLDVDRLRVKLLKKLKPATVKNVLELLRRIISFGEKRNLCKRIKFTIKMPVVNNEKTEDLTPKQLNKLLELLDTDSNKQVANFMKMALYTGMRRGELFNLKWDDIDCKQGFIHIRDPKGAKDQTIPLNEMARDILKNHPKTGSDYVFPGRNGNKRSDIKKSVNRIKDKAGISGDFRALHGLRHVYASMLASSGQVDMYTIQKLMTHKSPAMTQRYAHLRDDTLKRASNLVGELINQTLKDKKQNVLEINKK